MRWRGRYLLLAVVGLLVCAWLVYSSKLPPSTSDLSALFIGLTNDPGSSVAANRFCVTGNGRGLHALFAVTNISQRQYVDFGIAALETPGKEGWQVEGTANDQPELGKGFAPGYGYHFAIPWPATVKTNVPWRLRLWVKQERRLFSYRVHLHTPRGSLFRLHDRHTVTSEVVTPLRTDAANSKVRIVKAQVQSSTDGSQPLRSESP